MAFGTEIYYFHNHVHFLNQGYHPPKKLQEGNVVSRICSFCPQGGGRGSGGSHMTITRDSLTSLYSPQTRPKPCTSGMGTPTCTHTQTSEMGPNPSDLLLSPGGHHWRLVQTCSPDDPPPPPPQYSHLTHTWRSPKHVQMTSERYASYWNAFLLSHYFILL